MVSTYCRMVKTTVAELIDFGLKKTIKKTNNNATLNIETLNAGFNEIASHRLAA
jgi:hypothetical protein